MKKCRICNKIKTEDQFYIKKTTGNLFNDCKKCNIANANKYQTKEQNNARSKEWRSRNKTQIKGMNLIKYWPGLSAKEALANYKLLQEKQDYKCAICGKPETSRSSYGGIKELSVDHSDVTGNIRGLLCASCNTGIGNLKHCTDNLKSAILYLEERI